MAVVFLDTDEGPDIRRKLNALAQTADGAVKAVQGTTPDGSGNVTLSAAAPDADGLMSAADKAKLDGIQPWATSNASDADLRDRATHTGEQPISSVTGLTEALAERVHVDEVGAPGGIAPLDDTGRVPAVHLPGFVEDVVEYDSLADFPDPGASGKLYVAVDTSKIYRWSGSIYVEIAPAPSSTDSVPEGTVNLYHTAERVRSTLLSGLAIGAASEITSADTVLSAFAKLQAQISAGGGGGGGGTVKAVAGVGPNATGNVPLTAAHLGAVPVEEKGVAEGVATLDEDGKVPREQLPDEAFERPVLMTISPGAPAQVRVGEAVTLALAGTSHLVDQDVVEFSVKWWDGSTVAYTATAGTATATKTATGNVDDELDIEVIGIDSLGNVSAPVAVAVVIVENRPPVGPIMISAPTQVEANSTGNQVAFSGATDPDGDPITYEIVDTGGFVFSKTTGITESEIIEFSAPSVAGFHTISVCAVDGHGGQTGTYEANIMVIGLPGVVGVAMVSTGGNGGTFVHVDSTGTTIPTPPTSAFDAHPCFELEEEIVDGQRMIRVPKFYYKVGVIAAGTNAGKTAWWISPTEADGFTLHPAFMEAGEEIEQFWIGKYMGSESGGKLCSMPGVLPAVSKTLAQFRSIAEARNVGGVSGFSVVTFWQVSAIQMLYLVENATMNSQAKTGAGRVDETSLGLVDAADVAQATWRGIVGLWGNCQSFVEGIDAWSSGGGAVGTIRVWDTDGFRSLVSTGQASTGNSPVYPLTFKTGGTPSLAAGFIVATSAASIAQATAPDQQRFFSSYVAIWGGHYSQGQIAGLWCLNVSAFPDTPYAYVGARLAKV